MASAASSPSVEAIVLRTVGPQGSLFELFLPADAFPRKASAYLDDCAAPERGRPRKVYPVGFGDPHFDATSPSGRGACQGPLIFVWSRMSPVTWLLRVRSGFV